MQNQFILQCARAALVLLVGLLGYCPSTRAQEKNILDSIIGHINSEIHDTDKLKTYDELIWNWRINPMRVSSYVTPALLLASELNRKDFQILYLAGGGKISFEIGKLDQALQYYFKGAAIAEEEKNYYMLSQFYSLITTLYASIENYSKANEFLLKQKQLLEKGLTNEENSSLFYLSHQSQIKIAQGQFDSALYYNQKLVNISRKNANQNADEARYFVNDLRLTVTILANLKQYRQALIVLDSCKYILDTIADHKLIYKDFARLYQNYGQLYHEINDNNKALASVDSAIHFSILADNSECLMEAYKLKSTVYGALGNYQGQLKYMEHFYQLKDSLLSTDKRVKMTELEGNYQLERKNAILAQQEAETQKQKNQRNIFIYLALSFVIGMVSLIVFYRRIQKKNKLLAVQNRRIKAQAEELEKLNTVKDKMFSVISHDLRNPISTLKSFFAITKHPSFAPGKRAMYEYQMEQSVTQTAAMMDNLLIWASMQLRQKAPVLQQLSLQDVLEEILLEVKGQAALKRLSLLKDLTVNQVTSNHQIITIATRNILTNAIKFSQAEATITISTKAHENEAIICISDQGKGMSPEQIANVYEQQVTSELGTDGERGSGIGLVLVVQLLQQIGARLSIKSELGKGSTFSIHLPNALARLK